MPSPTQAYDPDSDSETLNPPPPYDTNTNAPPLPPFIPQDIDNSFRKTPLYAFILYGASLLASLVGLAFTLNGWYIARTAPFDKYGKKSEIDSYEKWFYGMMSMYALFTINILWTSMNIFLARQDKQTDLALLNHIYDLGIWGALIAFGVLNIVQALWDRRLCDGWEKHMMYEACDKAMLRLLFVEVVACALGMLVAVLHFILLISRCCTERSWGSERRSNWLQLRIREEEDVLRGLVERRRHLEEENELLAERGEWERSLPPLPSEVVQAEGRREREEDLIDV